MLNNDLIIQILYYSNEEIIEIFRKTNKNINYIVNNNYKNFTYNIFKNLYKIKIKEYNNSICFYKNKKSYSIPNKKIYIFEFLNIIKDF